MLERERQDRILKRLETTAFAPVSDLVLLTSVSEATIRRDLEKMQAEGLLRRIRGGAQSLTDIEEKPGLGEAPLSVRNIQFRREKQRIAEFAASLCGDDDLVFIDGGSTTYFMAPFLKVKKLRVVTSSFALAGELSTSRTCTVLLPGGIVYADSGLILDPFDNTFYDNFEADTAFMGAGAVTVKGIENRDMRVIRAERKMIAHARKRIILADSEKFKRTGSLLLCPLDDIAMIITDTGISENLRQAFRLANIELVIV